MKNSYCSQILVCPKTHIALKRVSTRTWNSMKKRLKQETVYTAFGKEIVPESAMIRNDHNSKTATYFYPVANGLVYLMPNDAVELSNT